MDLNKSIMHSFKLHESPFWALAPCTRAASSVILYGTSHGAHELLSFEESNYHKLEFDYSFDSQVFDKIKRTIAIRLHGSGENIHERSCTLVDKVFDPANMIPNYKVLERKSMFSSSSYREIMQDLFIVSNEPLELEVNQVTTSDRIGVVSKSKDGRIYDDGFSVRLFVNDDINLSIDDKSVIDMLVSLLFIDEVMLEGQELDLAMNYISTVLYKYVIDQTFSKVGVTIKTIDMKISIVRKIEARNSDDLRTIFNKHLSQGKIIPISTLQLMYASNSLKGGNIHHSWIKYMFWTALANPNINSVLHDYLPILDNQSRINFRTVCRDKTFLTSEAFNSEASLPWQSDMEVSISFIQWVDELAVRSVIRGDLPECIPLNTRSQWFGSSSKSFSISPPTYHRIAKFSVDDPYLVIDQLTSSSSMRDVSTKPPFWMKHLTRISQNIPNIFHRLLSK
jgi:hypothetical protein